MTSKSNFHTNSILSASCTETPDGYIGLIGIKDFTVKFSIKNVIASLAEGDIKISIEPYSGIASRPFNFHLKAYSDSNKEALARQLKLAFSDYSVTWTLTVNEIVTSFIEALNNHKQSFQLSEVEGERKGWLFEPFIMEHSINILFGMGSAGKTLTAVYLSVLYGQGKGLFNKESKQGNTLLIDFENDKIEWRDTLQNLLGNQNFDLEMADKTFFYWESEQLPLYNQVEKLKEFIRQKNISLVIVDSASMAAGDSTSDEASALRLMGALKLLNTSVLLIAHERKNDGEGNPIGSIQYFNQARNIWHVKGERDISNDNELDISCKHTKCNGSYLRKDPIGFKITFGDGMIKVNPGFSVIRDDYSVSTLILEELKSGKMTPAQISENINKPKAVVATTLTRLKKSGKVNNINGIWNLQYP